MQTQHHDPIDALIEAHKKCNEEELAAINAISDLEERLPREQRCYHPCDGEQHRETRHPMWVAAHDRAEAATDFGKDAALALLEARPTTLACTASLLTYVGGSMWANVSLDAMHPCEPSLRHECHHTRDTCINNVAVLWLNRMGGHLTALSGTDAVA